MPTVPTFALRSNNDSQRAVNVLTSQGLEWQNNGRTLWGHSEGHEQFVLPNGCQLPREWADGLQDAIHDGRVLYIVWSYETPIAWFVRSAINAQRSGWVMPDVRYSVTTSKHQSVARSIVRNVAQVRP